jgi:hypothetical protein
MKLANIIYEAELVNHTKVEYVNYINEATEYDKLDKTLPTLYVGWVFMKLCNPNNDTIQNANILTKKIVANQLYWECSFYEGKASHVNGIASFVKIAPELYFKPKYTYINLDPVFFQLRDVEDLMDVIPKRIDVSYNYKNEMLYLLTDNKITGINLLLYDYFKFDVKDIVERIAERTETGILDEEGISYQQYYKVFPDFQQLKRYLIVILSK